MRLEEAVSNAASQGLEHWLEHQSGHCRPAQLGS